MRRLAVLVTVVSILGPVQAESVKVWKSPKGRTKAIAAGPDGSALMVFGSRAESGHGGDVYFARRGSADETWSEPTRVNSPRSSAIVSGQLGPKMAIGKGDTIHVLWAGTGMNGIWFSRSVDGGRSWSPERDLAGADASVEGCTIAADGAGRVWAVWIDLGGSRDSASLAAGRLVVARSTDDGEKFGAASPIEPAPYRGLACACCVPAAATDAQGRLVIAFRGAKDNLRDIFLARETEGGTWESTPVSEDGWRLDRCPADGPSLAMAGDLPVVAWRSEREVYHATWRASDSLAAGFSPRTAPSIPTEGEKRFPVAAVSNRGEVLFAWAEGHRLFWELLDSDGKLLDQGQAGEVEGRTAFSVCSGPDGVFYLVR